MALLIQYSLMTELLQHAIAELVKLPPEQQDAIAQRLLFELADEQAWAARFNSTSDEQWDRLAALVRQEINAGDIDPLDEVFPPYVSLS
jgi:hypothetical protein